MPLTRWTSSALALIFVVASACGPGAASQAPPPSAGGNGSATPKSFAFVLDPVGGGVTAKGTITVASGASTTSIELRISGLQANSSHVSHIHVGSCRAPGGIAFALNQVVADGQGDADTRTTLDIKYPPTTSRWYVVVHAGPDMQGASASYLLCGNLF
jgi:hypothetical protein